MSGLNNAALYIRVSTDEQTEYSPQAQKRALLKYAEEHGYTVSDENVYVDEGFSGRKAEKRPAFMSMIAAARSRNRPFDTILVHKFDRFARSREDSVVYKSLLKRECGVRVISISESIEDDKFSVILEAILEAMAEYYSINLSDEVKKGMTEKALRGQIQSTAPLGYNVKDGNLIQNADERRIVRKIFSDFISGESTYSIARTLNAKGIRTRRKNMFETRAVEYILRNPVYMGYVRWNPKEKTGRDFKNANIIISKGSHKPIISVPEWKKAQQILDEIKDSHDSSTLSGRSPSSWLSGILKCSNCGSSMVYVKPGYFKCSGYIKGKCSVSQHVNCEKLYSAIIERLSLDTAVAERVSWTEKTSDLAEERAKNYERELKKLQKKKNKLFELYLSSDIESDDYKNIYQKINDEIKVLKNKISEMESNECTVKIETEIAKIDFRSFTNERVNETLKSIIEKCIWDKNSGTLKIIYRSDIMQ